MTIDLSTRYLGLELASPIVASACPLTDDPEVLRRLEAAGVGAAVFPSLFEEQIEQEELEIHGFYEQATESFAESVTYFPELRRYNVGPESYLRRLEEAKNAVSMPIIGSLNGSTSGGWVHYARLLQQAGADAIELNTYFIPADFDLTSEDVERRTLALVEQVRGAITIPLAVKVPPFFSSFGNFAKRLVNAGADGVVLFNRFVHPDVDLETLAVRPHLELSRSHDSRLPMTWIALLRGRIDASLAATSGLHTPEDVVKVLLVGADVAMVASSLYLRGVAYSKSLVDELHAWLEKNEYESVEQMKGSLSQQHCPDPTAFERAGYMRTLASFTTDAP